MFRNWQGGAPTSVERAGMDQALGSLPEEPAKKSSGCLVRLLLIVLGITPVVLYLLITPGFIRAPEQGKLTACKSHQKNLASCLDLYSSDNGGRYPDRLDKLVPQYLKELPTCPSSHAGYSDYQASAVPDVFSFSCVGNNHAKAYAGFSTSSDNFPAYHSENGLQDHP